MLPFKEESHDGDGLLASCGAVATTWSWGPSFKVVVLSNVGVSGFYTGDAAASAGEGPEARTGENNCEVASSVADGKQVFYVAKKLGLRVLESLDIDVWIDLKLAAGVPWNGPVFSGMVADLDTVGVNGEFFSSGKVE